MNQNVLTSTFLCDGVKITVATVRKPGETIAEMAARHDKAVAAAKKDCKPDGADLGPIQTEWVSADTMLYASSADYGQAAHDLDVSKLKVIYLPE